MDKSQEIDYQDIVKKLVSGINPENADSLVELTKKSTSYFSKCVLSYSPYGRRLESGVVEARLELEKAMKKVRGLENIDTDKFATNLTMYLFENRRR